MKRFALLARCLIVGVLVLLLLIPLSMIRGLIGERTAFRAEAGERVARSYAGAQTLTGPLRVLPYTDTWAEPWTDDKGVRHERQRSRAGQLLQMPQSLAMQGRMRPDAREVGLFQVRVYGLQAHLSARFAQDALPAAPDGVQRRWGTPYLLLGMSDVRGLQGTPSLQVDGRALAWEPGTRDYAGGLAGVSASLPVEAAGRAPGGQVEIDLALAGTGALSVVPVADDTRVKLDSAWPHPSFEGGFLPVDKRIDAAGFSAGWAVSSLASRAQQQLRGERGEKNDERALPADEGFNAGSEHSVEALTVSLVDPVDVYTQTDRATKYGLLFVLLTFVGFGLFELMRRLRIHPLQYLLVGLALAVFFLLLIGLSEHMPFVWAYLAASVACIGLQGVYLAGVLRSGKAALGFATGLTVLYGALYGLLQSEDNALLLGSLLLFGMLALVMGLTRKVDWYALGASR